MQALLDDFVTFCRNKIQRHISFAKKSLYLDLVWEKTLSKILLPCKMKYYIYSMRCSNNSIYLKRLISSIIALYETSKHIALKCKNTRTLWWGMEALAKQFCSLCLSLSLILSLTLSRLFFSVCIWKKLKKTNK